MLNSYFSMKARFYGLSLILAAALMMLTPAGSAEAQSGGFKGPGPEVVTVKQALTMRDDARVSLKGNIVKSLGDEVYLFQDATGSIEVEIDSEDWRGLTVQPEDVVIISGEVEKDWNHTSIDVSSVTKQ